MADCWRGAAFGSFCTASGAQPNARALADRLVDGPEDVPLGVVRRCKTSKHRAVRRARIHARGSNPPMGELDEVGRLRAYVVDLQSSLNAHLAGLGSHQRIEVDGEWGEHTALAFGRVCRVLGIEPARNVRTFRRRRRGHAAAHARGARARPGRRRGLRAAPAPSLRPRGHRERRWRRRSRRPPAATRSPARSAPTAGASRPPSCARPGAPACPWRWPARSSRRRPAFATSSATTRSATRSRARRAACWRSPRTTIASTWPPPPGASATRASGRCS